MPGGDNLLPLINAIKTDLDSAALAGAEQERFYISAGSRLKELKAFKPGDTPWPAYVKKHFGLSQERADELIRIADGKTTVKEVRAKTAQRVKKNRAKSVLRNTDLPISAIAKAEHWEASGRTEQEAFQVGFLNRAKSAIMGAQFENSWKKFPILKEMVEDARAAEASWKSVANFLEKLHNDQFKNL